jgi:HJR/Mrr/RecB family endonuclease
MASGTAIKTNIDTQISSSSMVITFVSLSNSKWVKYEIEQAVRYGKPVLAVQLGPVIDLTGSIFEKLSIPVIKWSFDKLLGAIFQGEHTIEYVEPEIITPNREIIVKSFSDVAKEIASNVARDKNELYRLEPRRFEELIAYIFEENGYEVTLTQATKDGGVDIYALKSNSFGRFLTVIDCKKYAENRPIGIGMVRQMYGTLNIEKASHAMLITTSNFTSGARDFEKEYKYHMSLKDHTDITRWLSEI